MSGYAMVIYVVEKQTVLTKPGRWRIVARNVSTITTGNIRTMLAGDM